MLRSRGYTTKTVSGLGCPFVTAVGCEKGNGAKRALLYDNTLAAYVRTSNCAALEAALLQNSELANSQNRNGSTLLMLACRYTDDAVVKTVLGMGANVCVCCVTLGQLCAAAYTSVSLLLLSTV